MLAITSLSCDYVFTTFNPVHILTALRLTLITSFNARPPLLHPGGRLNSLEVSYQNPACSHARTHTRTECLPHTCYSVSQISVDKITLKIGGKFVHIHTMKAYRESNGITPPFLNLGTRWR